MTHEKSKAKLIMSEPWEESNSMIGMVEEYDLSGTPRLSFTCENNKKYILKLRFRESQINDIWEGKIVIVNIIEFDADLDNSSHRIESIFKGIGSIELIR
jgi:hypothetical protein